MLLFCGIIGRAFADNGFGLDDQPTLSKADAGKSNAAAKQYLIRRGDVAAARPNMLLLVEANPAADFSYNLWPVLQDYTTYAGIVDVLEEAAGKADAKNKPFVLYNLMRVHEIRAKTLSTVAARKPYLEAARNVAKRFPKTFRDPGLYAVLGDIEADAGNMEAAAANYKKMGITGSGTPAMAYYKTGMAYLDAKSTADAEAAFKRGLSADAQSGANSKQAAYHFLYQGLAGSYMQKGDFTQAANAITESVRVRPKPAPPYLLLNRALELLQRNPASAKTVLDYANAALVLNPDAPGMAALRDEAKASVK